MNRLSTALRQVEPPSGEMSALAPADGPISAAGATTTARGKTGWSQSSLVEWPATLMEEKDSSRAGAPAPVRTSMRSAPVAGASFGPISVPAIVPVGVVTAAATPDPDVFVCLSTLDSMLESAMLEGSVSPPWPSETIDLQPATAMDLRRAAREANRRSRTSLPDSPITAAKPSLHDNPSPVAAALEAASEHATRPRPSGTLGERRSPPPLVEQEPVPAKSPTPLVKPRPLPRRGRDFIHKAMEKHLASEELLAAQTTSRPTVAKQPSLPRPIEHTPRQT